MQVDDASKHNLNQMCCLTALFMSPWAQKMFIDFFLKKKKKKNEKKKNKTKGTFGGHLPYENHLIFIE